MPARVMALVLLIVAQGYGRPQVATTRESETRIDFPSFGLSVPFPPGYVRDADSQRSIVWFVAAGQSVRQNPERMLSIHIEPMNGTTLATVAAQIAKNERMKVTPESVLWGGRPAIEVSGDGGEGSFFAVRYLLAERDGWMYRLAFATDRQNAKNIEAYTLVVKQTRWLPIASAGTGVAPRMPILGLPNGMFLSIPDPFRPDMNRKSKLTSTFEAVDFRSRTVAATLLVIPFPPRESRTLKAMEQECEENLLPGLKVKGPIAWQEEIGVVACAESPRLAAGEESAKILIAQKKDGAATVFVLQYRGDGAELDRLEKTLVHVRASISALLSRQNDRTPG